MSAITPPGMATSAASAPVVPVRAAQAAFFRAALEQAQARAPEPPAQPQAGAEPAAQTSERLRRPGALLDIRV